MIVLPNRLFANGQNCLSPVHAPVHATTSDVIEKNKYLVLEDLKLKERELSPLLGVSETTVFRILHE
jgi:hypothetical protein